MNRANCLENLDFAGMSLEEGTFRRLEALTSTDWTDAKHFDVPTTTCLWTVLQRFRRDQLFRIARALRAVRYKNAWPTLATETESLAIAIAAHVYSKFYRHIHNRSKPTSVDQRENDTWEKIAWQQAKPAGIRGIEDAESAARQEERRTKAIEEKRHQMIEEFGVATLEAMHTYTPEGQKEIEMAAKAKKKAAKKAAKTTKKKKPAAKATAKKSKKKSGLDYAADVLCRSSKALDTKTIAERAIKAGWETNGKTPHATLYAAIIREIAAKNGDARFRKSAAGLFETTGK